MIGGFKKRINRFIQMKIKIILWLRHAIVLFPIMFDVRGLRPDTMHFPGFSVWLFVFILWRHSPSINLIMKTQGKRSMSGLSPLTSNIIEKWTIYWPSYICLCCNYLNRWGFNTRKVVHFKIFTPPVFSATINIRKILTFNFRWSDMRRCNGE